MSDREFPEERLDDLIKAHPLLFRGQPPRVGSWLPAGWYELVHTLCNEIESMLGDRASDFQWEQIKEKFGTARLYWSLRGRQKPMVADIAGARIAGEPAEGPDEEGYTETVEETPFGFRLSFTAADELSQRIAKRIREAEHASATTCPYCGAANARARVQGGYHFVSCPQHKLPGSITATTWRRRMDARAAKREAAAAAKKKGKGDE